MNLRMALALSLTANVVLSVVCLGLVYKLSQVPVSATQVGGEVVPYISEMDEEKVEIGPWGPPVEHMKAHRKW